MFGLLGLFTGFFGKFKIYLFMGLAFSIIAGIAYFYYKDTQARLAALNQQIAADQAVIANQKLTIEQMEKNEEIRNYVLEKYYEELKKSREEDQNLEPKIPDIESDKDLGQMEDNINRDFNSAQKCFSLYSGIEIDKLETDKHAQEELLRLCGLGP